MIASLSISRTVRNQTTQPQEDLDDTFRKPIPPIVLTDLDWAALFETFASNFP